jgi:O-acetyl-ADP-ribose deacetylase (regulator of RNase III)
MDSISYIKGDATAPVGSGNRVICHVCNDVGGWGRGFVLALSKRWTEPEAQYRAWYKQGGASGFRLGAIQIVRVAADLEVANMIAQRDVRPINGVPPIRYDALRECLTALAAHATDSAASVHMPRIGCGLAGGTWSEVEVAVRETLLAAKVPAYVYDYAWGSGSFARALPRAPTPRRHMTA